jgi:hypothetical protein
MMATSELYSIRSLDDLNGLVARSMRTMSQGQEGCAARLSELSNHAISQMGIQREDAECRLYPMDWFDPAPSDAFICVLLVHAEPEYIFDAACGSIDDDREFIDRLQQALAETDLRVGPLCESHGDRMSVSIEGSVLVWRCQNHDSCDEVPIGPKAE